MCTTRKITVAAGRQEGLVALGGGGGVNSLLKVEQGVCLLIKPINNTST